MFFLYTFIKQHIKKKAAMKFKLIIIFLFYVGTSFSQLEVYYYKDLESKQTYNNIENEDFRILDKRVLEKYSEATFWFKIPAVDSDLNYIFRLNNVIIKNAHAYQNFQEVKRLKNQRFVSYKFSRKSPLYIKVNAKFNAYFPIELKTEEAILYKDKLELLINGFYYGIAFLVILFSIIYFYFFKDESFLYYAFLLSSLTFSLLVIDGMFNFFNIHEKAIEFLILLNYLFIAYCSSKFSNSFLLLDIHYPKVKKYTHVLIVIIILFVNLYLIYSKNEIFIILNILTFMLLFLYWFMGVLLFNKNMHIKLFTLGYVILLFSGFDFFVLRNLGITFIESNTTNMKIGGFTQIIILSFAVLFREKNLREHNFKMKNEIIKYSQEIKHLIKQEKEEPIKENLEDLSIREREIFDLIITGKSNKEIADAINISVNTVKFHLKNIYGKLNIKSRKEAIIIENTIKQ